MGGPMARWRSSTPEQGKHEPTTRPERRSGEAPLFDYERGRRQLTVWPDGTLEARNGQRTRQVSLVGAEEISVDYDGDELPVLRVRGWVFAKQTVVTVRDRLGKTIQVSVQWAIPLKVKQELEEVVAGFVGKVTVSLAWAGACLLARMAAEPTSDQPSRYLTVELRQHAIVLQARLAADPDDGAALNAVRRHPNRDAALQALTTAIHHRAEVEPGFHQALVALVHEAEQSGPTRWLDLSAGAGLGLAAAAVGALGWFLMVLISETQYGVIAAAVGLLVGKAVVLGSGAARSRRLQLVSMGVTLLGLIVAEYLIERHFLATFVAEEGGGPVPVLLAPGEAIALVRDGLRADPWTLVFWALALWPAWWLPAPQRGSGQGPRLPAAPSRRWRLAGLAAGTVVVVGLGVSVAFMHPLDNEAAGDEEAAAADAVTFVNDVRVGQCYQNNGSDAVPCGQPHDVEVFAILPLGGQQLPAEAELDQLAEHGCAAQFRTYVGLASDASRLDFDWWTPTKASWASGDRTLVCILENADASRLVGSMRGTGTRTAAKLHTVKLDRTANVGVFRIRVITMTCGYATMADLGAAERGQYCVLQLSATNVRSSPNVGFAAEWLYDADQRLLVSAGKSFEGFGLGKPLWEDELQPGQRVTTRLTFDLPQGALPVRLQLQADAYKHGGQDVATINLPRH
jgi:Septum formation